MQSSVFCHAGGTPPLIDSHCHILPNVDDGADSREMALAMAKRSVEEGFSTIVATPHYAQLNRAEPRADLERRIRDFQAQLDADSIALKILPGSELYITPEAPRLFDQGELITLNGGAYILVETAFHEYPRYVDDVMFQLQARGLRPILAHPERYSVFGADPSALDAVVGRGILTQVTAGSLLGHFGKKAKGAAEYFLVNGLAHVIATDAHRDAGARNTDMQLAMRRAAELVGEERAQAMTLDAPAAIVENRDVVLPPVVQPAQSGGWKLLRKLVGARN